MVNPRTAGWLAAPLLAVALAGCATTPHGGLSRSAARLDRSARAFSRDAQEAPRGYDQHTGYVQDAQDFAMRAREFRRTVVDARGGDDRSVRSSFDDLSRSYNALRDEVDRSGSLHARRDLRPVTRAYLDVQDDMGGARAPSRYSSSGDDDRGGG